LLPDKQIEICEISRTSEDKAHDKRFSNYVCTHPSLLPDGESLGQLQLQRKRLFFVFARESKEFFNKTKKKKFLVNKVSFLIILGRMT